MINNHSLSNPYLKFLLVSTFYSSKNPCGPVGLAAVLESLSYSSSIEELLLSNLTGGGMAIWTNVFPLSKALTKLFELTVSLKKVRRKYMYSSYYQDEA